MPGQPGQPGGHPGAYGPGQGGPYPPQGYGAPSGYAPAAGWGQQQTPPPYASHPGAPGPYGAVPHGVPGGPPQGQTSSSAGGPKKNRLPLLIGVGVVALALVAGLIFALTRPGGSGGTVVAGSTPTPVPKTPEEKATAVAQRFFDSIAAGKGEEAKSLLYAAGSADQSLLTDAAVQASVAAAPITAIVVGTPTGSAPSFKVPVTYAIGGKPADTTLNVSTSGDAKVLGSLPSLYLTPFDGVPYSVNGVKPASKNPSVFPGTYTVKSEHPNFVVDPAVATFAVTSSAGNQTPQTLKPSVSEAGVALFRQKVGQAVADCVGKKTLQAGCGLDLPATGKDGTQVREGTVNRSMDPESRNKLATATPVPGSSRANIVKPKDSLGSVSYSFECNKGGTWGSCSFAYGAPQLASASMDLTEADPVVQWN